MNNEGEEDLELVAKMDELYSKLGISVYDANGELKNTFGLLEALAEVYPTLTNAEKAYVTETIAGKYQAQNAAAILNNFQTAIDATATAFDSAGSAASENEKVLDSIQGKIAAFKSAFEELSSSLISSDFIKVFLSIGTALINMIGAFDGYAIKMAGFITVMMGISKGYHSLYNAINLLGNGIDRNTASIIKNTLASANLNNQTRVGVMQILSEKGAIDLNSKSLTAETKEKILNTLATTNLTKAQKEAILATIEQNVANATLTASTSTLKTALRGLWGVMKAHPIMLVLSIAATAFSAITSMINDARQKEIEAAQEALSEASELENSFSELSGTITQIQNLRATLDDSTSSYTDAVAAREELYEIQKDLISNYGLEADEIDLVNGSLDEQIERIKELRQEMAQDWLDENRADINKAEDEVYGKNKYTRKINDGRDFNPVYDQEAAFKNGFISEDEKKQFDELDANYQDYLDDINDILSQYSSDVSTNFNTGVIKFTTESVDASKKALEDWKDYLSKNEDWLIDSGIMSQDTFDALYNRIDSELDEIEEEYGTFFDLLDEKNQRTLTAAGFDSFTDDLKDLAEEEGLNKDNVKSLIDNYDGLGEALEAAGYDIDKLIDEYQNYEGAINSIGNAMGEDFVNDIAELIYNNNLTEESVNDLLDKYPELADELDKYGYSVGDFVEKLEKMVEEQSEWTRALQEFNSEIDNIQSAYDAASQAQEEFNENGYITIDTLQELLSLDNKYLDLLVDENGQINLNSDAFKALAQAKIDDLLATEEQRHYNEVYRIANEKLNTSTKTTIGFFSNLWNVLRGGKVSITETKATLEELEKQIRSTGDAALIAALEEENELHNNRVSLLKNWGWTSSSSSGSSSSSSSSSSSGKEWWEEELDKLKQQFDYSEITIEQYINGLDNLLGRVEDGSDAWREINDLMQEQKLDKVENDFDQGIISLDEYIDRLKELIKVYKQGTQAWDELADKIKDALQDKLDQQKDDLETAEDAAVGIIDDEIKKLEDIRDAEEERYDKLIEEKKEANEETEKELELARLQEALENARNEKTKRVWREGLGKKSAKYKGNYIGQMLEIVQTEVRLCLGGALWV